MHPKQYTRSNDCNLLTMPEAVSFFNLSEWMIEKLSKQCGAKLKIGRAVRYRKDIMTNYIETLTV